MCSGKSTLGRALAYRLGCNFIDLDDEIERRAEMSISDIFSRHGQECFRKMESETLADVIKNNDGAMTIVAVGGGTPCFGDNMNLMKEAGTTVLLEAPVERLVERLLLGQEKRPLVAEKSPEEIHQFVIEALANRRSFYERASHRFDASRLEDETIINQSVDQFIEKFLKQ